MRLEIRGLDTGYGKLSVVHGVDISVDDGEIVAILGANGAGKSTLLRAIAGLLPVHAGRIAVDGSDVTSLNVYERSRLGIGYVPQERAVFSSFSVHENLTSATLFNPERRANIAAVLDRFPRLAERSLQRASTLSGGERQMLAVGSVMVAAPRILLLDEPSAGLAPRFVDDLAQWIAEVAASGTSVVWVVEQNPDPVLAISSRTYVMGGGVVVSEHTSSDLTDPEILVQALFGGHVGEETSLEQTSTNQTEKDQKKGN